MCVGVSVCVCVLVGGCASQPYLLIPAYLHPHPPSHPSSLTPLLPHTSPPSHHPSFYRHFPHTLLSPSSHPTLTTPHPLSSLTLSPSYRSFLTPLIFTLLILTLHPLPPSQVRASSELERQQVVSEVRRQAEAEKEIAIAETKKKKWVKRALMLLCMRVWSPKLSDVHKRCRKQHTFRIWLHDKVLAETHPVQWG